MKIVEALASSGRRVIHNGENVTAQCPAHDDGRASLSISPRRDGNGVVLYCHAGCETADVVKALGMTMSDLFDDERMQEAYKTQTTYTYSDGRKVHRKPDKTFPQSGNTKGNALYRVENLGNASTVYIVEGEKDVLAIEGIGGTAVCSAMGAGKAKLADWSPLAGRAAVIIADKDEPGRKHAAEISKLLTGIASSITVAEVAYGKDAADHIAAGKSLDELVANSAPEVQLPRRQRLDDAHMAEYVATGALAGRFCWCPSMSWISWTGTHWRRAEDVTVAERVRQAMITLYAEEASSGAESDRLKAVSGLFAANRIHAIVRLAKGILEVEDDGFDAHPDLLSVGNGVVDLRTGELLKHDPALMLTKHTKTKYRPGATHRDWDTALTALPIETATWMQMRFGQAATGHSTPDDIMPVLQGDGSNGKTTLLTGVMRALGEHAVTVPERVLLANPSDHPTELMTLRGARLAVIEETPEARHLNVKRLKDVLGTEEMTARRIRENNTTWHPTHSLMLSSNYRPRVDETDLGTWRRLALVLFPYTFRSPGTPLRSPDDKYGDPDLRARIKAGRGGLREAILAWVIEGARAWYRNQMMLPAAPAAVAADTHAWREDSDPILGFVTEKTIRDEGCHILSTDLHIAFNGWLRDRGHREWSDQTFIGRLKGHESWRGIERRQTLASKHGLSRPAFAVGVPPYRYWAWHGMRFQKLGDFEDFLETPDKTAQNGQTARGAGGSPVVKSLALHENSTECPVHPVQSPAESVQVTTTKVCCPCGRPAPVNAETGLCYWCEVKIAKQLETNP